MYVTEVTGTHSETGPDSASPCPRRVAVEPELSECRVLKSTAL